jgi:hypothetical protein
MRFGFQAITAPGLEESLSLELAKILGSTASVFPILGQGGRVMAKSTPKVFGKVTEEWMPLWLGSRYSTLASSFRIFLCKPVKCEWEKEFSEIVDTLPLKLYVPRNMKPSILVRTRESRLFHEKRISQLVQEGLQKKGIVSTGHILNEKSPIRLHFEFEANNLEVSIDATELQKNDSRIPSFIMSALKLKIEEHLQMDSVSLQDSLRSTSSIFSSSEINARPIFEKFPAHEMVADDYQAFLKQEIIPRKKSLSPLQVKFSWITSKSKGKFMKVFDKYEGFFVIPASLISDYPGCRCLLKFQLKGSWYVLLEKKM